MTWQEELRRLDEELAAGRLAADDYRRQRDELLAQAASGGPVTPMQSHASHPGAGPFPPPFRWDAPLEPDTTQVIRPGAHGDDEEPPTTKVVRNGQPEAGGADQTQVVPGAAAVTDQQPQRPHTVPPWGSPTHPSEPPWANADPVMPLIDPSASWMRHGEPFGTTRKSRTARVLAVLGVVLVLLGIGFGSYLFYFRAQPGGTAATMAAPPSPSPPTTPVSQEGALIAALPGAVSNTSYVRTFSDVERIDYLTAEEKAAYRSTAADKSKLGISNVSSNRIIVLITQHRDSAGAASTRDALNRIQLKFNLTSRDAPPGVLATGIDDADPGPLRRAHYVSGSYVVRVQVQGTDRTEVERLFSEVLGIQLDELAANA